MARIPWLTVFVLEKTKGSSNGVYVLHILQLILFCNVFINNLHIFMSSLLMCVFPCLLWQHHHSHVLYYLLSLLFFVVRVSYCCTHVTTVIYFCVISVTVIYTYKILLSNWCFTYHSCTYVAIVSIKMCLSISNISKCGCE
jgi:hypothetical protein